MSSATACFHSAVSLLPRLLAPMPFLGPRDVSAPAFNGDPARALAHAAQRRLAQGGLRAGGFLAGQANAAGGGMRGMASRASGTMMRRSARSNRQASTSAAGTSRNAIECKVPLRSVVAGRNMKPKRR